MTRDDVIRSRIRKAIDALPEGKSLKNLSLALGRNHAYLQQYLGRGSPRRLPEDIRHRLARLLGINPAEIAHEHGTAIITGQASEAHAAVPFIAKGDRVPPQSSSSLPSSLSSSPWHFPHALLRQYGITDSGRAFLRLARIGDDSPDLMITRGDVVLLDTADRDASAAGYFALDMGRVIRVRHIEKTPDALIVGHDRRHGYTVLGDGAYILGRVLFHFRMLIQCTP